MYSLEAVVGVVVVMVVVGTISSPDSIGARSPEVEPSLQLPSWSLYTVDGDVRFRNQISWTWGLPIDTIEPKSTLLDAGHPKPDLVAVHAAVPDLQHLLVPSQGGGKRLKDGRFQTGCI